MSARYAVIIPACNEAPVIGRVLREMLDVLDPARFVIAVGVNGSSDRTAEIAGSFPIVTNQTPERGYGYGCMAAIAAVERLLPPVRGYIFCAGDGASDPRDIAELVAACEAGFEFVLGARTGTIENWRVMGLSHVLANYALGLWCALLAGRYFRDIAPMRLIDRTLFHEIAPVEFTYGWTIEAQLIAARLGARMCEVPARERPRLGGEQKVSGVSWRRTMSIGWQIAAAGWRARKRARAEPLGTPEPGIVRCS